MWRPYILIWKDQGNWFKFSSLTPRHSGVFRCKTAKFTPEYKIKIKIYPNLVRWFSCMLNHHHICFQWLDVSVSSDIEWCKLKLPVNSNSLWGACIAELLDFVVNVNSKVNTLIFFFYRWWLLTLLVRVLLILLLTLWSHVGCV